MKSYSDFLGQKRQDKTRQGFKPIFMHEKMFGFQQELTGIALEHGKYALFEDCGLGKTLQQLVWAENVVRHTNKPVLIATPLAVSLQTVSEAEKFGIEAKRSQDGSIPAKITVTNYERLKYFNPDDFAGMVCDESGILKNFSGAYKTEITEFMKKLHYRLLCTATAAPNDFIELGTSSEALGNMGYMDMLSTFFHNDQNSIKSTWSKLFEVNKEKYGQGKWRFKGHSEIAFWRWVASWSRSIRKPSDIGHDDDGFILPPLVEREHIVTNIEPLDGYLFHMPAVGLREERMERRRTLSERVDMVKTLVNNTGEPALIWCHMDEEGDAIEKAIPDAVQIAGKNTPEDKENRFIGFQKGDIRVLVTKPKIGAWGLNFQHCNHVVTFPSHSFEQYYQGIRRCYRFGQKRNVTVDIVTTEGELDVLKNLQRKQKQADKMFSNLVEQMTNVLKIDRVENYTTKQESPSWL